MSFAALKPTSVVPDENSRLGTGKATTTAASMEAGPMTRAGSRTRSAFGDISNQGALVAPPGAKPSVKPTTTARTVLAPLPPASEPDVPSAVLAEHGIMDVDSADAEDPNSISDYVRPIHGYFKSIEVAKSPRFGYMTHQTDINEKMRAILIDWLVEVHLKFKLMPETMYLTVNIIDRFLEKKLVIRQKLQLVGVTAMLLAAKYEEIYAPEVSDFVYITDKAYTRDQILAMEALMLNALDFRITVPTAFVFLARALKVAGADSRTQQLATFCVERCLQEYRMLQHLPSRVVAASVNIALRTTRGRSAWTPTMVYFTGFTEEELKLCILDVETVMEHCVTSSLQAVRRKYQMPRFLEVANISIARIEQ